MFIYGDVSPDEVMRDQGRRWLLGWGGGWVSNKQSLSACPLSVLGFPSKGCLAILGRVSINTSSS